MTTKQIQIEITKHLNIIANSTNKINILKDMLQEPPTIFSDMGIKMDNLIIEKDNEDTN